MTECGIKRTRLIKAAYCRALLESDDADLTGQEQTFKQACILRKPEPETVESWARVYDQIDQGFRELFSDYDPIEFTRPVDS